MFRTAVLSISLSLLLLMNSIFSAEQAQFSQGPLPDWVNPCDFSLEPIAVKPSQTNLQCLLVDTQRHLEEELSYWHYALKALTKNGVEQVSQLTIDFDPSYQKIIIHCIRLFRDGVWMDRLKNSRHQLLQRETRLEQSLYNGELSLVFFLDDIREGDIVDYSYSCSGQDPLFASHYSNSLYLQYNCAIEKISHRILAHPDRAFALRPSNTSLEPTIAQLSPSLCEWHWDVCEVDPYSHESEEPSWYYPRAYIQISQYKTWHEVAEKLTPLYVLPSDPSSEMMALVQKWMNTFDEPAERALAALRFVQDEIRYLGFEEGIGAFKPSNPNLVFQRRFGDCKDKSFLLHALLKPMNISSTPLLVNSSVGKILPDALPSPFLFNHVILQIELNGSIFQVDPTMHLQGGSLQQNALPHYQWGLLLADHTIGLTPIPEQALEKPIEIRTSYTLTSEDSANLNVATTFYGMEADSMRQSLEWQGLKKFTDDSLADIQSTYGEAAIISPLSVSDDRQNNKICINESYCIHTNENSELDMYSVTVRDHLQRRFNPARSAPYYLNYPLWVQEEIHVENPFNNWKPEVDNCSHNLPSLFYKHTLKLEGQHADLQFELKHLKDHIPPEALRDYWKIKNEIEGSTFFHFNIAAPKTAPQTGSELQPLSMLALLLLLWPLLHFFSRKKRPTQDELCFHLGRFWKFYLIFTASYLLLILPGIGTALSSIFVLTLLWKAFSNHILAKRSSKSILLCQILVGLQIIATTIHIFSGEENSTVIICWLFLGYSITRLNLARKFLIAEKAAAHTFQHAQQSSS